jgi:hypothetical protein
VPDAKVPQFKDYPADKIYTGPNHPLVISDAFSRLFRTRLRDAIKYGKPDFAGHYIVVIWGCGTAGCNTGGIIDAITGKAYSLPNGISSVFPLKPSCEKNDGQETIYRLNSRLMIRAGDIDEGNGIGYDSIEFSEFSDGEFKLLAKKPYGCKADSEP